MLVCVFHIYRQKEENHINTLAIDKEQSKKLHIPFPTGPHATGNMEFITKYSEEGCFARVFYSTSIASDQLDKYSDKWIPWIPNEMYLKKFSNALHVPYFIFKYFPPLMGQGYNSTYVYKSEREMYALVLLKIKLFLHIHWKLNSF
ncbi:uncharacterized protein LOC112598181 [Melanaphis sacchari]|uniref:uncharacterized protein LOC112598181 n=1 Tax=Melanaphis sacchari TaxID=742174 RepID=UPI000DC131EB|nr:uncharacterized protein LOC112598181 [Melanaphis sacchari]